MPTGRVFDGRYARSSDVRRTAQPRPAEDRPPDHRLPTERAISTSRSSPISGRTTISPTIPMAPSGSLIPAELQPDGTDTLRNIERAEIRRRGLSVRPSRRRFSSIGDQTPTDGQPLTVEPSRISARCAMAWRRSPTSGNALGETANLRRNMRWATGATLRHPTTICGDGATVDQATFNWRVHRRRFTDGGGTTSELSSSGLQRDPSAVNLVTLSGRSWHEHLQRQLPATTLPADRRPAWIHRPGRQRHPGTVTAGDDSLNGAGGTDTINGGAGNDRIDGGAGRFVTWRSGPAVARGAFDVGLTARGAARPSPTWSAPKAPTP